MKLRALLDYAGPYRWPLAGISVLMLLSTGITLTVPWVGGKFAGLVLQSGAPPLETLVLSLLALFAIQAIVSFFLAYTTSRVEQRILADLSTRIYRHLQALPIAFHHARRHGDLLALITSEAEVISAYVSGSLLSALPLALTALGAFVMMARIDPGLAFGVALLMPAFYLALKIVGRRLRPVSAAYQSAYAEAVGMAEENLSVLPAIKSFTREAEEAGRYERAVRRLERIAARQSFLVALLEPAAHLVTAVAAVLLLWFASRSVVVGDMTPESLVTFLLYAATAARPLSGLASLYGQTQRAQGALTHLDAVFAEAAEPVAQADASGPPLSGRIEVKDVHFAYPGRSPALRGISLEIAAGETVALTGRNGSGKTTLINLLLRFYAPQSGSITLDGKDITGIDLVRLRRSIGVVPQNVMLLNASVRDNIAFGKPEASDAEVEAAATLAQAHDFIAALPSRYATVIGDQGVRLSGGQRQRLALARALIKDPPILVLDEATAMFDPDGEQSFIRDCRAALAKRTVILITHRPASLALADRIIEMADGRIAAIRPGKAS